MIRFIENPNLPEGKVSCIICSKMHKEVLNYFLENGIEVIFSEPNFNIEKAVSHHVDLSAVHLGHNCVLVEKKQKKLASLLECRGACVLLSNKDISGGYPEDIGLNFALLGEYVIGNMKYADKVLAPYIEKKISVNVRQGYAKCSCLIVDEKSLITDDESIYRKSLSLGLDCLLISKGDISLPGHKYGFIGGAGGKISKEKIIFFGEIEKHRDYDKIHRFIINHGCEIVSFNGLALTDFGGIIPLQEEIHFES